MNLEENKNLEKLVFQIMKEDTLETPSNNFSSSVMMKINVLKKHQPISYTPIITKLGWFLIFCVVMIISLISINTLSTNPSFTNSLYDFRNSKFSMTKINWPSISNASFYAILSFTIIVLIQISLLKNYFNKKLTL